VEAGEVLVECRDASRVQLDLAPAGPDAAALASALSEGETVAAEPLLRGSGPSLQGLRPLRFESGAEHGGAGVLVPAENRAISTAKEGDREFRSWALRPGLRYVVRVPVERLPGRFVLPADAVVAQGPDTVVLLEDGSSFRPVSVRVEHRDARVVVVAGDGAVFPGDRVVTKGAYAVSLALQAAAGGGVDPHAGHHH
jgi:hypothetical protein